MSLYQTWWSYDSHVSSGHSQIHGRLWFQVKCLNINIMNRQKSCSATKMKLITLNVLYFFHNPIDKLIFLHYMTPDMRGLSCSKDAPFSWCLVLQRELRNQPVRVWELSKARGSNRSHRDTSSYYHIPTLSSYFVILSLSAYCVQARQANTHTLPIPLIRQMTGGDCLRCQTQHKGNYRLLQLQSLSSFDLKQHRRKNWSVRYYPWDRTGRVWVEKHSWSSPTAPSLHTHLWESGFSQVWWVGGYFYILHTAVSTVVHL